LSDVTETLQELMERRLRELGKRRGRGEAFSLHEAYERMLERVNDENARRAHTDEVPMPAPPTYEVFRRIRNGHSTISETTAAALATMLDVPEGDVAAAMGVRPPLGPFELPARADRLNERERRVVVDVVDAILTAAAKKQSGRGRLSVATGTVPDAVAAHEEEGSIAGEQEESDTP
jgi:hypothetical protein